MSILLVLLVNGWSQAEISVEKGLYSVQFTQVSLSSFCEQIEQVTKVPIHVTNNLKDEMISLHLAKIELKKLFHKIFSNYNKIMFYGNDGELESVRIISKKNGLGGIANLSRMFRNFKEINLTSKAGKSLQSPIFNKNVISPTVENLPPPPSIESFYGPNVSFNSVAPELTIAVDKNLQGPVFNENVISPTVENLPPPPSVENVYGPEISVNSISPDVSQSVQVPIISVGADPM